VAQDAAILLRDDRRPQNDALENHILTLLSQQLGIDIPTLQTAVDICSLHHCCRILGGVARLMVRDDRTRMAGAIRRRWSIAHQSFSNPHLHRLAAFMAPWEAPGVAYAEGRAASPDERKAS
jgi:aminoglycoside/choline kinase family phosphotransferase